MAKAPAIYGLKIQKTRKMKNVCAIWYDKYGNQARCKLGCAPYFHWNQIPLPQNFPLIQK